MAEAVEFVDECTVHVRGGPGGNGATSFRREAHVPRGGPDGGDGGNGGSVVLVADEGVTSLLDLHRRPHRRAPEGAHGAGNNRTGPDGDDLVLLVPVGTVVKDQAGGEVLADLTRPGQRWVAAAGGRGGRGNASFANRHRRVPRFSERGEPTRDRTLRLELKLIADVGLVGFPSAGKSSLISRLSAAKPRIEAWPFTTLTPHLGVMRAGDARAPVDVVLADVPGLIEGASEGKGLGHRFLRHIERCSVLLHVLDCMPMDSDRDPIADLAVLREELRQHEPTMLERRQLVVLNKVDLPDGQALADLVRPELEAAGEEVLEVSAVSGVGLDALAHRLAAIVTDERRHRDVAAPQVPQEVVLRPVRRRDDFTVGRHVTGAFEVAGERVERWVRMLPLDNPEAVRYLQGRMRRAGIEKALVDAGARQGDEVVIDQVVFEFDPDPRDLPEEEREALLAGELEDELAEELEDLDGDLEWGEGDGQGEVEA
ncbi:MAG: GTPase ObgE [Actinomycetes bacterium]